VSAVRMLARCELRRRWRGVVVLVLLVGIVCAVVLATATGARRSDSALGRFNNWSRESSVEIDVPDPTPSQLRALGRVPEVSGFAVLQGLFINVVRAPNLATAVAVDTNLGRVVDRARIVAGRAADPSAVDEITIGETLAAQLHLGVGGHLDAASFTPAQANAVLSGGTFPAKPAGPLLRFRIVGIVRRPLDLGRKGALGGVIVLTPAFHRAYVTRVGQWISILRVRTRNGAADLPRIRAAALHIFGASPMFSAQSTAAESGGVQNAIDVLALALWIFAGVAAVAGAFAIGTVLTREISLAGVDQETLRALGLTRVQGVAMSGLRVSLVAGGGAVLAAVGAVAASPLFPIGVARRAEPQLGVQLDWTVLMLGIAAVVAVVFAIAFVAAFRSTRKPAREAAAPAGRRASTVPELAARSGLAPTITNGLRMALQPGHGRTAVPVRSAFLGAMLGVLGVTAVLGYASSVNHLAATRRLYGWTWDFTAADSSSVNPNLCSRNDLGLLNQPGVGAVASVCEAANNIQLDGRTVNGWSFTSLRGTINPEVVKGRAPSGPQDVALGSATMSTLGKHIGDTVQAAGPHTTHRYQIVGQVVFPTFDQVQPLADGAAFTGAGFAPLFDQNNYNRYLLGRFTPGVDRATVEHRIAANRQLSPVRPALPVEIDRLRQIDWFPGTLAGLLAGLALVAVGHALVTAVRRRRRELALLKTLGFTRRQVRATVAWQATTLAGVGLVIGIPVGIIIGNLVWRTVAAGLGVTTTPNISIVAPILTIVGGLALVNLIAAIPARAAAHTQPAVALRTE
jgi:hypothetical protein